MASKRKDEEQAGSFREALLGKISGLTLGTDPLWEQETFTTGLPPMDAALGGGYPKGGAVEIFGPYATGKTLLIQLGMVTNEERGGDNLFLTSEMDFNRDLFFRRGGDPSKLLIDSASTVEKVFHTIRDVCRLKMEMKVENQTIIGWDSIAFTGTKHLQAQGLEGSRDMTKAQLMSQGGPMVLEDLKRSGVTVIAANQEREVIKTGHMPKASPHKGANHTPGGRSFGYFCWQRIQLDFMGGFSASTIVSDGESIGRWVKGVVKKNRTGRCNQEFFFPVYEAEGYRHPEFDCLTPFGIDIDESLFKFYNDNSLAVFGAEKERFFVTAGPTKKWSETMQNFLTATDRSPKAFYKKEWPQVLKQVPELRDMRFDPNDALSHL